MYQTGELLELSHRYGRDAAYVLAGGGNTSSKSADRLWVKASGHALATIDAGGFVALDRRKLDAMLAGEWPTDAREREAQFLSHVMESRIDPARGQRPSVEALLHHLLPDPLVVHTHSSLVNAVTCCTDGERWTREWFAGDVLWQPYVDPGVTLAQSLQRNLGGRRPAAIVLENHGLIVSGDSRDAIEATTDHLVARIAQELAMRPAMQDRIGDPSLLREAADVIVAHRPDLHVAVDASPAAAWLADDTARYAGPLTPDQIVYCRSWPVRLRMTGDVGNDRRHVADAWAEYVARYDVEPWVAVVENAGVVACRTSTRMAETTRDVFADAAAVARNATRLGGVRPLAAAHRRFIEQWEVEAYRRSIAEKAST